MTQTSTYKYACDSLKCGASFTTESSYQLEQGWSNLHIYGETGAIKVLHFCPKCTSQIEDGFVTTYKEAVN